MGSPQRSAQIEVVTAPLRWWHIERLMPLERELFGAERWTQTMFWSELAQSETRYYRIAVSVPVNDSAQAVTQAPDASGADLVILGYGGLCVYGEAPHAQAWIQTIGVDPAVQGRGVGRSLLEDLLTEAKRRGAETVSLEVRSDNERAQRLYARYGFEPIGIRKGYYQPSNTDALTMTKEFG